MKQLIYSTLVALPLMATLNSCNKPDFTNGVSTSIEVSEPGRQIIHSGEELTSLTYVSTSNFVHEERGKVEEEEFKKGYSVMDFTVNRVWVSTVEVVDYSHVDLDPNITDLSDHLESFELQIWNSNFEGEPKVLAIGTAEGYLESSDLNFYQYTQLYPDFILTLNGKYTSQPGTRSLLINVHIGISYDYTVKKIK
ncbi:hypothetical protein K6119_01620 [Paracrocinitomix mangrovi]|uniref:hypothetical protein n=1 Tax=Paracrocinitomix mangrovi TaxID=2862509 RepID=UPI001C8D8E30|nr:hypothetical protein [Paracrocinitomix mangrovi]UKN02215.1 hypothetical protein K6119_01620 [Paracrocinitomix mangrovi]